MKKIDIFFPIVSVLFVFGIWVMLIFSGCPKSNPDEAKKGIKDSILVTHSSGGFCFICEHENCVNVGTISYIKETSSDLYIRHFLQDWVNFNTTAAVFMEAAGKCSDRSSSAPTPGPKPIPIESFDKLPAERPVNGISPEGTILFHSSNY